MLFCQIWWIIWYGSHNSSDIPVNICVYIAGYVPLETPGIASENRVTSTSVFKRAAETNTRHPRLYIPTTKSSYLRKNVNTARTDNKTWISESFPSAFPHPGNLHRDRRAFVRVKASNGSGAIEFVLLLYNAITVEKVYFLQTQYFVYATSENCLIQLLGYGLKLGAGKADDVQLLSIYSNEITGTSIKKILFVTWLIFLGKTHLKIQGNPQ